MAHRRNGPTPFFSTVEGSQQLDSPRLLLISFHFPPGTAVGGLRWQQMAKYVVARGWGLDVITRDPAALKVRDEARLRGLPANVRVFAAPEPKPPLAEAPARAWRMMRRRVPPSAPRESVEFRSGEANEQSFRQRMKNDYLAWLEYHIAAALAKSAADVGSKLAADSKYVAVATSGPPQMAHETGRIISAKFGIPLVLDFRDPWSLQEYVVGQMASPVWFRLAERYERAAIRQSSVVALNTDPLRDAMLAKYPELRDRAITVRNGCDNERLPKVDKGSRFTIRFAGEIYIDRDPRLVFRAAGRVVRDLALTPREFGFQLIGLVEMFQGVPLTEIARQEGLGGFVETGPYRPRAEALEFLAGASMLLSLPQDARMSIPAKIYEYIQFDAWLLVLARSESPTAALLRGTDADIIAPDDVDRMSEVIRRRYEQFARGERAQPVAASGQFDRVHQARILLDRIAQVAKTAK
jgi:hypothetical protein